MIMRRLQCALLAAVAAIGMASIASAADMPAKKVTPFRTEPLPVAYNWSGVYIGGNVGYSWENQDVTWPGSAAAITSFNHKPNSGMHGIQIGAQYQWTNLVLGLEGVWYGSGNHAVGSPLSGCPNAAFSCETGLANVWTVGPRLGWAINDWLLYGTAGYANGFVKTKSYANATLAVFDDFGARHGGWFAGAGVEYALWKMASWDVIAGVEYQHMDLGTTRLLSPGDGGAFGVNTRDVKTTSDLVRLRLSIKANVLGR
jgi:outer membrane immunogenic protein